MAISCVITHQQKQLEKLTTIIQQISKTSQNFSLPGKDRGRIGDLFVIHVANLVTLVGIGGLGQI